MALWPFGKKKQAEESGEDQAQVRELIDVAEDPTDSAESTEAEAFVDDADSDSDPVSIPHDVVNGESGPFDGDSVDINDFDFSDVSDGVLNLGSIALPLPKNSQVQVEMGENGPRMLHVVTEFGRMTPVAFAAPNSGGMWEESSNEIAEGMRSEGMPTEFETGPWGREVVGRGENGIIRIIAVEGPRWLYRMTAAAPHGKEDYLADLARSVIARSFIYRGTTPVLAGNSLPVEIPAPLAAQLQQAMAQQAQRAQQTQHLENEN